MEVNEAQIKIDLKDGIIKEALNTGLDLRQYSQQVELELNKVSSLKINLLVKSINTISILPVFMLQVELASVEDYITQGAPLAQLHSQFVQCDVALERMEQLLSTFRSQLGGLSSDILQLQHQSAQLGLRLGNRQGARSLLGQIVDDLVIPESLIRYEIVLRFKMTNFNF